MRRMPCAFARRATASFNTPADLPSRALEATRAIAADETLVLVVTCWMAFASRRASGTTRLARFPVPFAEIRGSLSLQAAGRYTLYLLRE